MTQPHYEQIGDPLRLPFARLLLETTQIRAGEAYRRLVTAGAAFLTAGQQEALRVDALKGLSAHDRDLIGRAWDQLVTDMEARPYVDLLGPVYMALSHKADRDHGGEFYTPRALSVILARLSLGAHPERAFTPGEILSFNEPTAGTAGMVLATAEVLAQAGISPMHTRWVVQDISDRACYAAYINTSLWGVPALIVCGDTLRLEVRWQWPNVHLAAARPWPTDEERRARVRDALRSETMISAMRRFLGAA